MTPFQIFLHTTQKWLRQKILLQCLNVALSFKYHGIRRLRAVDLTHSGFNFTNICMHNFYVNIFSDAHFILHQHKQFLVSVTVQCV